MPRRDPQKAVSRSVDLVEAAFSAQDVSNSQLSPASTLYTGHRLSLQSMAALYQGRDRDDEIIHELARVNDGGPPAGRSASTLVVMPTKPTNSLKIMGGDSETHSTISFSTFTLPEPELDQGRNMPIRSRSIRIHTTPEKLDLEKGDSPSSSLPPSIQPLASLSSTPQSSRLHELLFVASLCSAQFISLCGLSLTVAPWKILSESFGITDPGAVSWFTASYSLVVGTLILPAGRLGDMYGHKLIFMIGWAWFAAWTLLCGFTDDYDHVFFSLCRALQGAGPALLVPNAMAMIYRAYPPGPKRAIVLSCFGAMVPIGFCFGALMASIMAQYASWPWAFRVLAILQFLILIASYFTIPWPAQPPRTTLATRPPTPTPTAAPTRPKFDILGCITGVSALVLINIALNQAPISGWHEAYIWETLLVGLVFFGFFIFIELYYAEQPLIPLRGLKKEAGLVLVCIATGWGAHGIWLYYLFLFQEGLRSVSAVMASTMMLPVAITGVGFAMSTVYLMRRFRSGGVMCLAMMLFTVGAVFVATAPVEQTYWANTFLSVVVMSGGMILSFPAAVTLLSSAMPAEHQGIAASLVATVINYSMSCGLGLAGTVDLHASEHGEDVLEGYRAAWYLGGGITILGLVVSMWFVWKSWGRK